MIGREHRVLHASLKRKAEILERCLLSLYNSHERLRVRYNSVRERTKNIESFVSYFDKDGDGNLDFQEGVNALKNYVRHHTFGHIWSLGVLGPRSLCNALFINEMRKLEDYLDAHYATVLHFYNLGQSCENYDSVKDLSLGFVSVDAPKSIRIYDKFGIKGAPSKVLIKKVSK